MNRMPLVYDGDSWNLVYAVLQRWEKINISAVSSIVDNFFIFEKYSSIVESLCLSIDNSIINESCNGDDYKLDYHEKDFATTKIKDLHV